MYSAFLHALGEGRPMVLSSTDGTGVTSRMMSVILLDGVFYFQTDRTMRKYTQLLSHPAVALCIDNIQIEGICRLEGKPVDSEDFCRTFEEVYKGSFDAYTKIENEVFFSVRPTLVQRWIYKDGKPFVERFDVEQERYFITEYITER